MQYFVNTETTHANYLEYQRCKDVRCFAHVHSYLEMVFVLDGALILNLENHVLTLSAGKFATIMPFEIHGYDTQNTSDTVIISFTPEFISEYYSTLDGKTFDPPIASTDSTLDSMVSNSTPVPFDSFRIKSLIYYAVSILNQTSSLIDKKFENYDTYRNAIRYSSEHFTDENISLHSVAQNLGITRVHLSRVMNQRHREGFSGIVNSMRIQHAKILIERTQKSLSEIAYLSGFGSIRNFNRIFKSTFGCNPKDLRMHSISINEVEYSKRTKIENKQV